jgi:DNA-binding transcriptional LysR family regulator
MGVEVRHLAALEAVAAAGSFHGAADRLGYTQSAVSQQVAALERIVGQRLVERPGGPRPVSLTAAGAVLLRHAEAIRARLVAAQADLAALAEGGAATLRLGAFQSAAARLLPELLPRFARGWPEVEVLLSESATGDELVPMVERGEIDLAFAALPLPDGPLAATELLEEPFVLLVGPGHRALIPGDRSSWSELARLPLVGQRDCASGLAVERALRERGHELDVVARSDDNGTIISLVTSGVAAALIPRMLADLAVADRRLAALDVEPPLPARRIGIAWHRDRELPAPARAFVELTVAARPGATPPPAGPRRAAASSPSTRSRRPTRRSRR